MPSLIFFSLSFFNFIFFVLFFFIFFVFSSFFFFFLFLIYFLFFLSLFCLLSLFLIFAHALRVRFFPILFSWTHLFHFVAFPLLHPRSHSWLCSFTWLIPLPNGTFLIVFTLAKKSSSRHGLVVILSYLYSFSFLSF